VHGPSQRLPLNFVSLFFPAGLADKLISPPLFLFARRSPLPLPNVFLGSRVVFVPPFLFFSTLSPQSHFFYRKVRTVAVMCFHVHPWVVIRCLSFVPHAAETFEMGCTDPLTGYRLRFYDFLSMFLKSAFMKDCGFFLPLFFFFLDTFFQCAIGAG